MILINQQMQQLGTLTIYKRFNEDIYLVLVAYNAGPTFTSKAIQRNSRRASVISYKDLLSAQTRNYIPKFLALIELINNNEKYGVDLPEIPYSKVVDKSLLKSK